MPEKHKRKYNSRSLTHNSEYRSHHRDRSMSPSDRELEEHTKSKKRKTSEDKPSQSETNVGGNYDTSLKAGQMEEETGRHIPSSVRTPSRKKLIVLDLNGILVDIVPNVPDGYKADTFISRKALFKRPFCDDFLKFLFQNFNVGVWSSRTKKNVDSVVDFVFGDMKKDLLFCWDQYHCTDTGYNTLEDSHKPLVLKELKKLWNKHDQNLPWKKGAYNESNTILLDDSPYKALRNPPYTAIFPPPYRCEDSGDKSLGPGGDLRVYLEGLLKADDVQDYVEHHRFGQRAITYKNPSWGFYLRIIGKSVQSRADISRSQMEKHIHIGGKKMDHNNNLYSYPPSPASYPRAGYPPTPTAHAHGESDEFATHSYGAAASRFGRGGGHYGEHGHYPPHPVYGGWPPHGGHGRYETAGYGYPPHGGHGAYQTAGYDGYPPHGDHGAYQTAGYGGYPPHGGHGGYHTAGYGGYPSYVGHGYQSHAGHGTYMGGGGTGLGLGGMLAGDAAIYGAHRRSHGHDGAYDGGYGRRHGHGKFRR